MNRAFCTICGALAEAEHVERDGKIYLERNCPACGRNESLISNDSSRYQDKHKLDVAFSYRGCGLTCLNCAHGLPNLVFLDLTNRCNMNCPICINNTPSMGFAFEPPMDYFEKIFQHFGTQYDPPPAFQLFGGEPTVRKDLMQIVDLARSYKIPVRLVTNGLKLADEEYARQLVQKRVSLLVAYDGRNRELYRVLRGTEKVLDTKIKAIDNICKIPRAKVVLMSLVAKGFNDKDLPHLFEFCHARKDAIRGIYFMPLAHTWSDDALKLEPERITSEDVENIVNEAFPDGRVDFIPAGLLGQVPTLMKYLRMQRMPFGGAHPNCESLYVLVSNGREYVPLARYLKHSLLAAAADFLKVEEKLAKIAQAAQKSLFGRVLNGIGLRESYLRMRARLLALGFLARNIKAGAALQGRGPGKLWHAAMLPLALAFGSGSRKSQRALAKHTNIHGTLQLIILPFEDSSTLETERMERCPCAFAFYDPQKDEVQHVPVCAWGLHKTKVMKNVSDYYMERKNTAGVERTGRDNSTDGKGTALPVEPRT